MLNAPEAAHTSSCCVSIWSWMATARVKQCNHRLLVRSTPLRNFLDCNIAQPTLLFAHYADVQPSQNWQKLAKKSWVLEAMSQVETIN
eukprot:1226579-Pleurochrysis_carterae.AAC.2